jgi:hypothetical protein
MDSSCGRYFDGRMRIYAGCHPSDRANIDLDGDRKPHTAGLFSIGDHGMPHFSGSHAGWRDDIREYSDHGTVLHRSHDLNWSPYVYFEGGGQGSER